MSQPLISPDSGDTTSTVAPASRSFFSGTSSSDCSKPCVARIAIFFPAISAISVSSVLFRAERENGARVPAGQRYCDGAHAPSVFGVRTPCFEAPTSGFGLATDFEAATSGFGLPAINFGPAPSGLAPETSGFEVAATGLAKSDCEVTVFGEMRSTILLSSQLLRFAIEAAVSPLSSPVVQRPGSPIVRRMISLESPESFQP